MNEPLTPEHLDRMLNQLDRYRRDHAITDPVTGEQQEDEASAEASTEDKSIIAHQPCDGCAQPYTVAMAFNKYFCANPQCRQHNKRVPYPLRLGKYIPATQWNPLPDYQQPLPGDICFLYTGEPDSAEIIVTVINRYIKHMIAHTSTNNPGMLQITFGTRTFEIKSHTHLIIGGTSRFVMMPVHGDGMREISVILPPGVL